MNTVRRSIHALARAPHEWNATENRALGAAASVLLDAGVAPQLVHAAIVAGFACATDRVPPE